ncbi:hypothetical protein LPJ53_002290 [Coemansia erecta]|uniref:Bola-like protein n=1 Tax=Coemansia erecta TaxID=147472 RepID=A0A9W8CTZ4_9FUNG|nr:hypothetical protein LPJ53_002290 [Coemansia erecta]
MYARTLLSRTAAAGCRLPAAFVATRALSATPFRLNSETPAFETSGEQHIYEKLKRELSPTKLTVKDSSGGCGSMYVVEIEAECFRGKSRIAQTKIINALLKSELKDMHGMRILCSVPPE